MRPGGEGGKQPRRTPTIVCLFNIKGSGTSLAVQWLRLRASNAGGAGSIGELRSHMPRSSANNNKKKNSNKGSAPIEYMRVRKTIYCQVGKKFQL